MKQKYEMLKKYLKEEFRLKEEMMKSRHTNVIVISNIGIIVLSHS